MNHSGGPKDGPYMAHSRLTTLYGRDEQRLGQGRAECDLLACESLPSLFGVRVQDGQGR